MAELPARTASSAVMASSAASWALLPRTTLQVSVPDGARSTIPWSSARSAALSSLAEIRTGLNDTKVALDAVAKAGSAPAAAPARRRGPDPNKRYTLKTSGRPAKGASRAKVEIVEFSDFQ